MGARLILVEGRLQRSEEGVVHLVAQCLTDRTGDLNLLSEGELRTRVSRADEVLHPQEEHRGARHPRNVRILPKSRDFH